MMMKAKPAGSQIALMKIAVSNGGENFALGNKKEMQF